MAKRSLLYLTALLLLVSCQPEEPEPLWLVIDQFEWQPDGEHVIAVAAAEYAPASQLRYSYYRLSADGKTYDKLSDKLFTQCGGYPMPFYLQKDGTQTMAEGCTAVERFSISTRSATAVYNFSDDDLQRLIAVSPDFKYAFIETEYNDNGALSSVYSVVDVSGKTYRTVSQDSLSGMNLFPSGGLWLDGGHIAIEGNVGSTNIGIVIIDTSCNVKSIISRDRDQHSSSGSTMFYNSSQRILYFTDKAELYKYSLDDTSIVALSIGKNIGKFAVTPDGEYIVYRKVSSGDGLFVRNMKTAALDTVSLDYMNCFRISPDGTKVAYSDSYNGQFVPMTTVEIPRP